MAGNKLIIVLLLFCSLEGKSNEGLWLPLQLPRLQGLDLQKMGLHLTAEEIYSINSKSLKDAIVSFNNNCTAHVISKAGLLLTNHHCGYQAIQMASSPPNNLIEKGFWAENYQNEIPNTDVQVKFLVRMEDVTLEVLGHLDGQPNEKEREEQLKVAMDLLERNASNDTHYDAEVKSFFSGNEYYLFVYETFKDIRLVGVPPETLGGFGGETDNWEWPRHTADFTLFRVYTGADGKPAEYHQSNTPLNAKYHLPLSLDGVSEGDFTMVMGYPAKTKRTITSSGLKFWLNTVIPNKSIIAKVKMETLKKYGVGDPSFEFTTGNSYKQLNNSLKYYQGQMDMAKLLNIEQNKAREEARMDQWSMDLQNYESYGSLTALIKTIYEGLSDDYLYNMYLVDAVFSSEILLFAYHFSGLSKPLSEKYPRIALEEKLNELQKHAKRHFSTYHSNIDQELTAAMVALFYEQIPKHQQPEFLKSIHHKYDGDFRKWSSDIFSASIFSDDQKVYQFLDQPNWKTLAKDPVYKVMRAFIEHYYGNIAPPLKEAHRNLNGAYRLLQKSVRNSSMRGPEYSDANGTLRVSFGKVTGYKSTDHHNFHFQTFLCGKIQKSKNQNPDYKIPEKLERLYALKNYGEYGENGIMPVAFITNNDISSGNSGSPVINSQGHLVGLVFDSNKESLANDYFYNDEYQRSINVDIRYVLFIIDKYAGAKHLVDEMTIVRSDTAK